MKSNKLRKLLALLLAGAMSLGLASCGSKDSSTDTQSQEGEAGYVSEPTAQTVPEGTYFVFDLALEDTAARMNTTADDFLAKAQEAYSGFDGLDAPYGEMSRAKSRTIQFSNGAFTAFDGYTTVYKFEGSCTADDSGLSFNYDKLTKLSYVSRSMGGEEEQGVLTEPKITEYPAGGSDDEGLGRRLSDLSSDGSYISHAGSMRFFTYFNENPPSGIAYADGNNADTDPLQLVPVITGDPGRTALWQLPAETYALAGSERLSVRGDFLCGSAVGWSLDDGYTPGESFTVTYDPSQTLAARAYEETEGQAADALARYETVMGTVGPTKIAFNEGYWKWTASDGTVISSGEYTESTQRPGFIIIKPSATAENKRRGIVEYVYIEAGSFYYPYAIKAEQ
ncbi:MAG: hypothetical protein IJ746_06870 [Ruminococcus sp.]|nr:hypothetical protein [Ruminococcus sp.]